MASRSYLASEAIGSLFSSCAGISQTSPAKFSNSTATASIDPRDRKRDRRSSSVGGNSSKTHQSGLQTGVHHWWTGSSDEMDSRTRGSNRGVTAGASTSRGGGEAPSEKDDVSGQFVNHGLQAWNENRKQWLGNRPKQTRPPREKVIKPGTQYGDILSTSRPFPRPVPLPEMVSFLVEVWEQEGLYD